MRNNGSPIQSIIDVRLTRLGATRASSDVSMGLRTIRRVFIVVSMVALLPGGPSATAQVHSGDKRGPAAQPSPSDGATGVSACIDLDWNDVPDADSYEVFHGTDASLDENEYLGNTVASWWPLPQLSWGATYYWRVDTVSNGYTTTGSVWTFTTEPEPLSLTSPNGGEAWSANEVHTIAWTSSHTDGSVHVVLYENGLPKRQIAYVPLTHGHVDWLPLPWEGDGPDYQVRVSWSGDPCVYDENDSSFSVVGSVPAPVITVLEPDGGEQWEAGSQQTIRWSASDPTGIVEVAVIGPGLHPLHTSKHPMNAGIAPWTLSPIIGDSEENVVEISSVLDPSLADSGDGSFTIFGSLPMPQIVVTSPNGGETLSAETTHTVTWEAANPHGLVRLEVCYPGNCAGLGYTSMESGQFDWEIPLFFGGGSDYTMHVRSHDRFDIEDYSDGSFTISGTVFEPTVVITAPNGGEVLSAGEEHTITWSVVDPVGSLCFWLKRAGYSVDNLGCTTMDATAFDWTPSPCSLDATDYIIQARSTPGYIVSDESDAPFAITDSVPPPTLTLTSPNGGEVWPAGTTQTISWDSSNAIGEVDVHHRNGDGSWEWVGSAPMADGQLRWDICSAIGEGTDYTIRIEACDCGPCISDYSDSSFEVAGSPPSFTVTSPNGGEVWQAGTTQTITWDSTNPAGEVTVWQEKGDGWWYWIESVPMVDGQLSWDICPSIGDAVDYTIKIQSCECYPCLTDESDAPFEITGSLPRPTITLTNPNGGEVWPAGTTRTIAWESDTLEGDVSIDAVMGDGDWLSIGWSPVSEGAWEWDICPSFGDGSGYTIRLHLYSACGSPVEVTSSPFEITDSLPRPTITLTSPNGGEVWSADVTQTITWDSTNAIGNVRATGYHEDNSWGYSWGIGQAPMADGQMSWDVCPYTGDGEDYMIMIESCDCGPCVYDETDAPFDVTGMIQSRLALTSPPPSTVWQAGTTQTIAWSSEASEGVVHISAFAGDGDWFEIGQAPVSDGVYEWDICPSIGDNADYTIRLIWLPRCGIWEEVVSYPMEIIGSLPRPTITLTSPNGGEAWEAGTTETITWSSINAIGDVHVHYRKGDNWEHQVGSAPVADGQFSWDICPSIGDGVEYTIWIEACGCGPCVSDESDEPLEITGAQPPPVLELTSPNGGEVWQAGTTQTITWDGTNPAGEVTAYLWEGDYWGERIGSAPMASGQMSWDICPYIRDGDRFTVSILSCDCGPCVGDESEGPFEIAGSTSPPATTGDYDSNNIIDLADYSQWPNCLSGPAEAYESCVCGVFDWDDDSHVDLRDHSRFQLDFSTP